MIYLDSASTTLQKPPAVSRSVAWAVKHLSSPGRGGHRTAMSAAETAFNCRLAAARLFNVSDPENVVLTFNATHALNIAIKSLVRRDDQVLISGYEHNAVTRPLYAIGARVIVATSPLFDPDKAFEAFERRLTDSVSVVICNHVSNVFGFILPVERIAALCRARKIPLILDASQSAGVLDIDFMKLGAEFICMPGHKGLYGPQGTGLLLCAGKPDCLIQGGTGSHSLSSVMPDSLPDRLEAGTHNMPGIAGLIAGMDFVEKKGVKSIFSQERELINYAAQKLSDIEQVQIFHSDRGICQSGVLSINTKTIPCESLASLLAERDIAVRAGLHCAPLAHKTVGTLDKGTLRVSVSCFNTKRDIDYFLMCMRDAILTNSTPHSI